MNDLTDNIKQTYVCTECNHSTSFNISTSLNITDENGNDIDSKYKIDILKGYMRNDIISGKYIDVFCPKCGYSMKPIRYKFLTIYKALNRKGYNVDTDPSSDTVSWYDYKENKRVEVKANIVIFNIHNILYDIFYRLFCFPSFENNKKKLTEENFKFLYDDIANGFCEPFKQDPKYKVKYDDPIEGYIETILDIMIDHLFNHPIRFFELFNFKEEGFNRQIKNPYEPSYQDNVITIISDTNKTLLDWCKRLPNLRDINEVVDLFRKWIPMHEEDFRKDYF